MWALALAMAGSTEGLVGDLFSEGYLDAHVRKLKVAYGNSRPLSFFSGLEFCDESQWQRAFHWFLVALICRRA